MNKQQYKEWLEKHGNLEEREAIRVVDTILDYHLRIRRSQYEVVQFFPHTKFKGMEFDLLILLTNEEKELKNFDYFDRLIGIEFKDADTWTVINQAIERKPYVDYQYVATRNVWFNHTEIFLLTFFGIGWVIWEDGWAKLVVPAKMKRNLERVEQTINYLISKKLEKLIEEKVNKSLKDFLSR